MGDLMGKALWKLVENAQRFPRRGGRVLCVHGPCVPGMLDSSEVQVLCPSLVETKS